jgi:hypothetical protein
VDVPTHAPTDTSNDGKLNNGYGNGDQSSPGHSSENQNANGTGSTNNDPGNSGHSTDVPTHAPTDSPNDGKLNNGYGNGDQSSPGHSSENQNADGTGSTNNDPGNSGHSTDVPTDASVSLLGAEVFKFELSDLGVNNNPAEKMINTFDKGDVLDLKDVLDGNHNVTVDVGVKDTVIHIADKAGHMLENITIFDYHSDPVSKIIEDLTKGGTHNGI